jgi:HK97 family phage major capsid protein
MTEETLDDLEKKIAEVNAANNKLIYDLQQETERKLKGFISEAAFAEYKAQWDKRWNELNDELAKAKSVPAKGDEGERLALQKKAFRSFLVKGLGALEPEERKVLTVADSTHAGVLAPYEYVREIIKGITVQHPLRDLATVVQTSSYAVEFPTETAIPAATWVSESSEKTETTGLTYGLTEIKTFEMKQLFKATQKMLEDSAFNLEAEIASVVSRKFGVLEGTAFYSGNGTSAPEGIITNTTVLADALNVATDNTLAIDDIIKCQYQLGSAYAKNAAWVMNRSLVGIIVSMKSATTNLFLVQPNLQEGQPARLLGSPIYEWSDFPAITSTSLGTTPGDGGIVLGYGDFKAGYRIVDRVDIIIQRLVERYAEYGMVGFLARRRVGGGVVLPEAIQLLKNQTS